MARVPYPVDLRAAVGYTESGGYGPIDPAGVPLCRYQSGVTDYNPTTIAQYALGLHQLWVNTGNEAFRQRFLAQADWLLKHMAVDSRGRVSWAYNFDYPLYNCRKPWTSGLAQAQVLSVLVRAHGLSEQPADVLPAIVRATDLMLTDIDDGGFVERDGEGNFWWAEYPATPGAGVLNGHMFATLSMLEIAEFTANPELQASCSAAVATASSVLPEYDTGYWVRYDRHYRALASEHYLREIYLPLLRALHRAADEPLFLRYAERWNRYLAFPYLQLYQAASQVRRLAGISRAVSRRAACLAKSGLQGR